MNSMEDTQVKPTQDDTDNTKDLISMKEIKYLFILSHKENCRYRWLQ